MRNTVLKKLFIFSIIALTVFACKGKNVEDEFISGSKRRSQKEKQFVSGIASTVYTVPEMNMVQVRVDVEYDENKYMDIYYPPKHNPEKRLPVVIVYNDFVGLNVKDMGTHIDWAMLIAAHGMIGVTYNTVYAEKDLRALIDNLKESSEVLGLDTDHIGLLCSFGSCPGGLRAFRANEITSLSGLTTGVFLYGRMPWWDDINPESSILMVKTGKGLDEDVKLSIDTFYAKAREVGIKAEVINHINGYKYFDITENPNNPWEYGVNAGFTENCDVMKKILAFFQAELLETSLSS